MFFRRGLGLIIAVVLLFSIGSMVTRNAFRSGWQQGYLTAKVDSIESATAEDGAAAAVPFPSGPRGFGHHGIGYGHGGFGFFGFLAVFFLGLMMLKFLFGGRHRRRWHHRHGKAHPWADEDEPVQKA